MSLIKNLFHDVEKVLLGAAIGALSEALNVKSPSKFQPGDVELVDIVLLSEDQQRTYSLMKQVIGMDVYESILSPSMFAELIVADSIGLLQNFPILGGEYIKISFKTPKNKGKPAEFLFRVKGIENKSVNESNKRLTYTITCVSSELINNSKTLLTPVSYTHLTLPTIYSV